MAATLLLIHGLLEMGAGAAMILAPGAAFPYLRSKEQKTVGQSFGVAIVALGVTGFLARNAAGGTQMVVAQGAFAYHALITALFVYIAGQGIASDKKVPVIASALHGTLAFLFARLVFSF
mmetsp:Transcript_15605/g.60999  ORF Transcript_15605/g.60999 Transcript_15605/m.60999 type:complete len:120 (-) Transcript_15605:89-448(-)